jgi:hypothetical protein
MKNNCIQLPRLKVLGLRNILSILFRDGPLQQKRRRHAEKKLENFVFITVADGILLFGPYERCGLELL